MEVVRTNKICPASQQLLLDQILTTHDLALFTSNDFGNSEGIAHYVVNLYTGMTLLNNSDNGFICKVLSAATVATLEIDNQSFADTFISFPGHLFVGIKQREKLVPRLL